MADVEEGFAPHVEPGADASPEPEVEETVEAEAEAAEEPEVKESEGESPPPVEENDEEKTNPFQERIDKLTENWRTTERALTSLEQENEALRKQVADIPTKVEDVKTLADFDYDDKAYQGYLFGEAEKRAREVAERVLKSKDTETRVDASLARFTDTEKAFAKEHDDYYEVAHDPALRISQAMAEVIRESDVGPALSYHLGKNPDVARNISSMTPVAASRELTKIELKLQSESKKVAQKVSKAPPPPPANIGGGEPGMKVSTTDPKSDKLSDEEWFKAEEKRKAKLMRR